jgi:hypothetical protein
MTISGSRLVGTLVRARAAASAAHVRPQGLASLSDDTLRGIWSGKFGRDQLSVDPAWMTITRGDGEPITVTGRIVTGDHRQVGSFMRTIDQTPSGELEIMHDALGVGVQRSGFGTAFNQHALEGYERIGVSRVHVQAESDGAVAWALSQPGGRGYELHASEPTLAGRMRSRSEFIWDTVQQAHRGGRISDAEYGAMLPRMHDPIAPRAVRLGDIRDLHSLRAYDSELVAKGQPQGVLRRVLEGASWSGTMELRTPPLRH